MSKLERAGLGWADDVTLSAPGTAFVAIRRGYGQVLGDFDLSTSYLTAGRALLEEQEAP